MMNNSFDIIDGQLYIDKELYNNCQCSDHYIVALTGCDNQMLFKNSPTIRTGIESITIDYYDSDTITIDTTPQDFVEEIKSLYHSKLRGCITINDSDKVYDLIVNNYQYEGSRLHFL